MVEEKQIIFQIHSPLVKKALEGDNYKIEFENIKSHKDNVCAIYFSSNEIYYPNTPAAFEYSIIKKNRYEWYKNRFPNANKHIFIRDIKKQWYIEGINSNINSIPKLLEFLKKEVEGYQFIILGSSAGGFAAILFGSLLNANRVYAFNAQLNLHALMKESNQFIDPLLFQYLETSSINQYFDLSKFIVPSVIYYYFQSCLSDMDIVQYQSICTNARKILKPIFFKTSNHGFPFLRNNLQVILSLNESQLNKFVNKRFNLLIFSIKLIGITPTFTFILKALFERYKKKELERKFRKSNG